jgi:iron-sulfur cluster repair protein YtfE (RIC family)
MENSSQAIRFLMDDHKRIKGLFRQFEAVDRRAHVMKAGVCRQTFMEIEIHSEIEENFLYPTLDKSLQNGSLRGLVGECMSDHDQVDAIMAELKQMDVYHEEFDERMNDLIAEVELHLSKEEGELFSQIHTEPRALLAIDQVANDMVNERMRMLKLPQYADAQPERVQDPSGGEQKRIRPAA